MTTTTMIYTLLKVSAFSLKKNELILLYGLPLVTHNVIIYKVTTNVSVK